MLLRIRDFFIVDNKIFVSTQYSYDDQDTVKCLLRYLKSEKGSRSFRNQNFKKLNFYESFDFLEGSKFISNEEKTQRVNKKDIDEVFRPEEGIEKPNVPNELVECFLDKIPEENLGVTGSRLLGLNKKDSDIDFVVYGLRNFHKARNHLDELIGNEKFQPLSAKDWRNVYKKRKPPFSFNTYLKHSKRKKNKAKFGDTRLDLLFVRSESELPKKKFEGKLEDKIVKIEAKVVNDKYIFDSPAIYEIDHSKFSNVVSFSHTFAGQAFEGERIIAKGRELKGMDTLVAGSVRKPQKEYIVSKHLRS